MDRRDEADKWLWQQRESERGLAAAAAVLEHTRLEVTRGKRKFAREWSEEARRGEIADAR